MSEDLKIHSHHHVQVTQSTAVAETKGKTASKVTVQDSIAASTAKKDPKKTDPSSVITLPLPSNSEFLVGDMAKIFTSLDNHQRQQWLNQQAYNQNLAKLAQTLGAQGDTAIEIQGQFYQIIQTQEAFQSQINGDVSTQTTANTTFNSAVSNSQSEIDTYNAAQATYSSLKNPTAADLQTFNNVITAYNNYVNGTVTPAVTTYNNSITDFQTAQDAANSQLPAINPARSAVGVPAISNQTQTTANAPPLNTIPPATATFTPPQEAPSPYPASDSIQQVTIEPDSLTIESNYYVPLIAILNAETPSLPTALKVAQNINNNRINNLSGPDPTGNCYIPRHHHVEGGLGIFNAGGGVALAQLSGTQNTGVIQEATIARAVNTAFQFISSQSQAFAVKNTRTRFLPEEVITEQGKVALGLAFGVEHGQILRDLINSGVTKTLVTKQLEAGFGANVDENTKNNAIDVATALVNQQLIQNAVAQQGLTINASGLYGQFVTNQTQLSAEDLKKSAEVHLTAQEVLSDPQKQYFLKTTLSDQLANSGLTNPLNATKIVEQAVNSLIAQGSNTITEDQIKESILKTFAQEQVDENKAAKEAAKLAQQTADILHKEQTAQQVLYAEVLNPTLLRNQLQAAGIKGADQIATTAIDEIRTNSPFVNNAQFQIALQNELATFPGITPDQASLISQNVVANAANTSTTTPPLSSPILETQLSIAQLSKDYHAKIVSASQATGGLINGVNLADQAVSTYIESQTATPSLRALYNKSQETLITRGQTQSQINESNRVRNDTAVTFEQQMTLDQHFEQGKLFLYLGLPHTGASWQKWYKESIDVLKG